MCPSPRALRENYPVQEYEYHPWGKRKLKHENGNTVRLHMYQIWVYSYHTNAERLAGDIPAPQEPQFTINIFDIPLTQTKSARHRVPEFAGTEQNAVAALAPSKDHRETDTPRSTSEGETNARKKIQPH